jgi:RNA polymerase sigma-70 factor (ECF subfamily)
MDNLQTCAFGPAEHTSSPPDLDDFDSLVHAFRPRVLRFVLASLRDPDTAENITQECFVRAFKARGQFLGKSALLTWLMQIATNLIRDHESSGRARFWKKSLRSDVTVADLGNWVDHRQASPEALAAMKEQMTAIWNAAGNLPSRQRTVFLLRFVEEMELLEIAAVTGMKEGTVKSHLFRALQTIRAGMQRSDLNRRAEARK